MPVVTAASPTALCSAPAIVASRSQIVVMASGTVQQIGGREVVVGGTLGSRAQQGEVEGPGLGPEDLSGSVLPGGVQGDHGGGHAGLGTDPQRGAVGADSRGDPADRDH